VIGTISVVIGAIFTLIGSISVRMEVKLAKTDGSAPIQVDVVISLLAHFGNRYPDAQEYPGRGLPCLGLLCAKMGLHIPAPSV